MGEEFVGAFVTEAPPVAPEPGAVPETGDGSDAGADAFDFKEYDLNELDLGEVDKKLFDYGAYEDYGTAPPQAPAAYDDEVGLGVAAETDVSVSMGPPELVTQGGVHEQLRLSVHDVLLAWHEETVIVNHLTEEFRTTGTLHAVSSTE